MGLRAWADGVPLERFDQLEQLRALPGSAPLALVEPADYAGVLQLTQGVVDRYVGAVG